MGRFRERRNDMDRLASNNIQQAQSYIRQSMVQIGEISDYFSCMPGSDKSRLLKSELNKIFTQLPVAINEVTYRICKFSNGFVYKWEFGVSVPYYNMVDGIRRATDVAVVTFIDVPDEDENPLSMGFMTSDDFSLTSSSSMKDGILIDVNPHSIKWNNN